MKSKYICPECGREYAVNEKIFRCECGSVLVLEKEITFPIDKIKNRVNSIWRYREAIPIDSEKKHSKSRRRNDTAHTTSV